MYRPKNWSSSCTLWWKLSPISCCLNYSISQCTLLRWNYFSYWQTVIADLVCHQSCNFHLARCSRLDSYISVLYCIRQEQLSFSDSSLFFVSYFIESKISSRRKFLKIKVSPGKIWVKDNWTKQNKDERNKVMKCLSNMTVFFNLCSSRNVQ